MKLVLPSYDQLGVLRSTAPVVSDAAHVHINVERIDSVATDLISTHPQPASWTESLHFADGSWRTAAWVLVLDTLNFCFWSTDEDPDRRWRVEWRGQIHDGYWALATALHRAVEEGWELWEPRVLAELTPADLATILRPVHPTDPPIPLFPLRRAFLQEMATCLLELGSSGEKAVTHLIAGANGSALQLIDIVTTCFPSFRDVATWQGSEVRYFKRAQILAADLHAAFEGDSYGKFNDLDILTAFADYKVPQVLRRFGLLEYSDALRQKIVTRSLIPAGSLMEQEIRSATIWTCELLRQSMTKTGVPMRAFEIDWVLWQAGQSLTADAEPYHHTLTGNY